MVRLGGGGRHRWGMSLAVTVVYVVAAKLGLSLAFVADNVSPVWPPSGFALCVLLLGDWRYGPALWLGAFLATASTGVPLPVAAGVACGNFMEYAAAAALLKPGFHPQSPFSTVREVVVLAVGGCILAPTLAATMGTISLVLGGIAPESAVQNIWLTWWLGDCVGVLLFAPLLCAWYAEGRTLPRPRIPEAVALIMTALAVSFMGFWVSSPGTVGALLQPFLIFPVMVWAALRFGGLGTTAIGLLLSLVAIGTTLAGHGPFLRDSANASLLTVQTFLAMLLLNGLVLNAVVREREKARERAQWLGLAADQSAASILITDAEGIIRYANPAFTERTGYTAEEVLGERPSLLKSGHTTDEDYRRLWETILSDKVWHGEFLNRRKDGSTFWELASIAPVMDNGVLRGFVAVKEDISARKAMESALTRTIRQLDRSKKELEQIAYVVTHDLQEPLRSIVGFCQLLEKRSGNLHPEETEYFAFIIDAAQRLKRMLNDLMDYSLVDAPVGSAERIDLNTLLATLVRELAPVIRSVGATVSLPPLPTVRGWPRQIATLFRLLLFSALSAPSDRAMMVTLVVVEEGDMWRFVLSDTGRMVPEEELERIFALFRPSSRFPSGSAGLALARRIVEHHGGEILLESDAGLTTISFTLPREEDDPAPGAPASPAFSG